MQADLADQIQPSQRVARDWPVRFLTKGNEQSMPSNIFKVTVVQHWLYDCWIDPQGRPCDIDAPGARLVKARKVKAGTPGAKKVKKKSSKWYGRVPGSSRAVPLST